MAMAFRQPKAYSLTELTVVVAIIAIAAATAAPKYSNSLALYRAQAAAQRIAADINLSRVQAKISSLGQSIVFNLTTNSYSMPGMTGLTGMGSSYNVSLSADPYTATLTSVNLSSTTTLTFDRFGHPSAGGTVVVQSGSVIKTIIVDPTTGFPTVQ